MVSSTKRQRVEWLSQSEWVLQRPAALIGSVEPVSMQLLTYDGEVPQHRTIDGICPALLSLFNELVSNALDNSRRDAGMRHIRIRVGTEPGGWLCVSNDGQTLPVQKYEGTDLYQPTVAFGRFQASTNFDVEEEVVEGGGGDGGGDGDGGGGSKVRVVGKACQHTIGQNGVGSKGTNVFGKAFTVRIANAEDGLSFEQAWRDNMTVEEEPVVAKHRGKRSETTVRWLPDWARLGMPRQASGMDPDVAAALGSLAYHASLCAPPSVKVFLDDKDLCKMKTPLHFVQALGGVKPFATDTVYAGETAVLSLCCAARPEGAAGAIELFVNGTRCPEGTHARMLLQRVGDIVLAKARKKDGDAHIKPAVLRGELVLFATMLINSPTFDSALKTTLDTKQSKFGWTWEPSAAFRGAIERSPLVERALVASRMDAEAKLSKSSKPSRTVPHIPKYEPAMWIGKKDADCSLILCEGDSAKGLAVAGLSVIGRELYGVFPLKGKLLNTRNHPLRKIAENAEISNLVRILGLEWGHRYDAQSAAALPYRWVLTMTDQDVDGDHIQGLVLNFLVGSFPSLFEVYPDFVRRMATPVIRVTLPGGSRESFFTEVEYRQWCEARRAAGQPTGKQKYYKGLGTSTAADARQYFGQIAQNSIDILHTGAPSDAALEEWFDDKKAAERRLFLQETYDPQSFVDYREATVEMERFIHDGLSHFSNYDNIRSIPSAIDGLKPSQRKVLFCMREKNIVDDMKVAQLMGMVAERTAYHHGEVSLGATIVGMALDHAFSNNVALLVPEGTFGTRHAKNDAASPRYIFTKLDPVCRAIFRPEDDAVLEYNEDDGRRIEPVYFVPVLPLVLVNGASGIGTGWRTDVPNFAPADVIAACEDWVRRHQAHQAHQARLAAAADGEAAAADGEAAAAAADGEAAAAADGEAALSQGKGGGGSAREEMECMPPPSQDLVPWYRDFAGTIVPNPTLAGVFDTTGCYEIHGTDVHVTELAVGTVTDDYVEDVRKRLLRAPGDVDAQKFVIEIVKRNTDSHVLLVLRSTAERLRAVVDDLPQLLRLTSRLHTSQMNMFDARYQRPMPFTLETVVSHFATVRMATYEKRLAHIVDEKTSALRVATNKMRYIGAVRDKSFPLTSFRDEADAAAALEREGFSAEPTYDYLLHMRLSSLTQSRYDALAADAQRIAAELEEARGKTPAGAWLEELSHLRGELLKYDARHRAKQVAVAPHDGTPASRGGRGGKSSSKRARHG